MGEGSVHIVGMEDNHIIPIKKKSDLDLILENKFHPLYEKVTGIIAEGGNPHRYIKACRKHFKKQRGLTLTQRLNNFQKDQNKLKANGY